MLITIPISIVSITTIITEPMINIIFEFNSTPANNTNTPMTHIIINFVQFIIKIYKYKKL